MAGDMLVKLYDLPDRSGSSDALKAQGIVIKRALAPDKRKIAAYVEANFGEGWASECEAAFANNPISCFIAVKDKELIGFACYDATARGYFGPTGVTESARGKGAGKALLLASLQAMREYGYGYAIIGWVDGAIPFYEKTVDAKLIENSLPGVYSRMIDR